LVFPATARRALRPISLLRENAHQPAEALVAYQAALQESPNRSDSLYGAARAAESAGKTRQAKDYFAPLSEIAAPGADRPELEEAKVNLAKR
jgi:hypothetical protein